MQDLESLSKLSLTTSTAKIRGLNTAWMQIELAASEAQNGRAKPSASKPIAMLLHGYPDSPECWDLQFESLAAHCQIIAPWIRGAGESESTNQISRYGSDAIVLDHLEILNEVDPSRTRKVFIVGHDLGGVHAINLAHALADRCAGLVIINSLALSQMVHRLFSNRRQSFKSWYIALMQIPVLPEKLLVRFEERFLKLVRAKGGMPGAVRPKKTRGNSALAAPINQYRALLREAPRAAVRKRPKLKMPVLVLWGRDDAFLEPPTQDEMDLIALKPTVRILKGNHWIHRENAAIVNDLLTGFIKGPAVK